MPGLLDDNLAGLQATLDRTHDYAGLLLLEGEARTLERALAHSPRLAALIGAILRRRLEWEAASIYLMERSTDFLDNLELRYDAALTAIDAGTYDRGQLVIQGLGPHLDALDDRQLCGLWRAAPLVGLHDIALAAFQKARDRGVGFCTTEIEGRLATARDNVVSPILDEVGVVSLGENCLGSVIK